MTTVYIIDDLDFFDEQIIKKAMSILPQDRIEKIQKYRFFKDKRLSCLVYLLYVFGVKEIRSDDHRSILKADFFIEEYGKPGVKGFDDFYFSFSHCVKAAACGFSNVPIGIDVQEFERSFEYEMLELAFTHDEISNIRNSDFPYKTFTLYWSVKESYLKCLGTGLIDNINDLDFSYITSDTNEKDDHIINTKEMPEYQIAVCTQKNVCNEPRYVFVSPEQLLSVLA